jgi:hypothetical protein
MLSKQRILGVAGSKVNVQSIYHAPAIAAHKGRSYEGNPMQVTAALGSGTGTSGYAGVNVNGFFASSYQYYMTGIIPADPHLIDTSTLALFYRKSLRH